MTRNRLPGRRPCETFEFTLNNLQYVASVGYSQEGHPAELFVNAGKAGTHLAISVQEAAILVSLALQYGAPLETIRGAALRAEGGRAEGPIGHLVDLICARMAAAAKPLEPVE